MSDDGSVAARGSDANYCSYWKAEGDANEGHHMVSRSVPSASLIRFVELCSFCGWIDGAALDRWAEQAFKEQMGRNAQLIAVAAGTEPFAFAQMEGEELTLENVLGQALGAASMCWADVNAAGEFDSTRAARIYGALKAEVDRFMRLDRERVSSS